ncbi:alanine racemase [Luteimicrobium subarcticum]|uniref:D-serine deaminase-like pyridoxal phosphate-dependent protein n=1 Tax=Luteimicrobium subarcticum TaxID=620910 RepID=A0A2M8WTD0_9MICO|nr:alanine racemase [Luteimicrobium subarcticum]PJI94193.1 D-serine deaminase-like pyridoxal phosphate-dependent protein [Luteimicrobium subarcticum]
MTDPTTTPGAAPAEAPARRTERLDRPIPPVVVGPRTKGLRLRGETAGDGLLAGTASLDDGPFGYPLLTLETTALDHNVATMAAVLDRAAEAVGKPGSVEIAPHVKTHMSAQIFARQLAGGAWGATVASPAQLRVVRDWGVRRVFLANELTDPWDAVWVRDDLERDPDAELWVYVDSVEGVTVLSRAFAGVSPDVAARCGVLVELGVEGGRTGVRSPARVLDLARAVDLSPLTLLGVAGYEGAVAHGTDEESLAQVRAYCEQLRATAERLVTEELVRRDRLVISAGGSAYLDVVLDVLPGAFPDESPVAGCVPHVVVRSGAYVVHDHGFYGRMDPLSRIPGAEPLHPAATVVGTVLSVPEPGLALVGIGRRDVPFDIDLPVPLWVRATGPDGNHGPALDLGGAEVTALNDQHLFLHLSHHARDEQGLGIRTLRPGDVVGFGISHPCTLMDKWRVAVVMDGERPVSLVQLDF